MINIDKLNRHFVESLSNARSYEWAFMTFLTDFVSNFLDQSSKREIIHYIRTKRNHIHNMDKLLQGTLYPGSDLVPDMIVSLGLESAENFIFKPSISPDASALRLLFPYDSFQFAQYRSLASWAQEEGSNDIAKMLTQFCRDSDYHRMRIWEGTYRPVFASLSAVN